MIIKLKQMASNGLLEVNPEMVVDRLIMQLGNTLKAHLLQLIESGHIGFTYRNPQMKDVEMVVRLCNVRPCNMDIPGDTDMGLTQAGGQK